MSRALSPIQKHRRGSRLQNGERRIIHNVYKYFTNKCGNMLVKRTLTKTAEACGVSTTTVQRIIRDYDETGSTATHRTVTKRLLQKDISATTMKTTETTRLFQKETDTTAKNLKTVRSIQKENVKTTVKSTKTMKPVQKEIGTTATEATKTMSPIQKENGTASAKSTEPIRPLQKAIKSTVTKVPRLSTAEKLDEFIKSSIRRKAHSFYLNNDYPTIGKVLILCKSDKAMPPIKRPHLKRILHQLGYYVEKRKGRSVLFERNNIMLWRRKYLKEIKEYRERNKNIYFVAKTRVNTASSASNERKSLIVWHIGGNEGFIENGILVFESNSIDYYEKFDVDKFLLFFEWFKNITSKLKPGSVVVIDFISSHSVKEDIIPTSSCTRAQLVEWLQSRRIVVDLNQTKQELLEKVSEIAHNESLLEETAGYYGIEILRLPPYHCNLNPIELLFVQTKDIVAVGNTIFELELNKVKNLFYEAISLGVANTLPKFTDYVYREELNMWNLDDIMELAKENIFTKDFSCNSSDCSSDTE